MKVAKASANEKHVRVSVTISQSVDFRNYLATSRDSYPMGLGRLVALGLHCLAADRHHFSRFELDRIVQWPADRKLSFYEVLEMIGWARPRANSRTLVELALPEEFVPRKPLKEKAVFRRLRLRNEDGQFASREEVREEILMYKNRRIILIDMDGREHDALESVTKPVKKSDHIRRTR